MTTNPPKLDQVRTEVPCKVQIGAAYKRPPDNERRSPDGTYHHWSAPQSETHGALQDVYLAELERKCFKRIKRARRRPQRLPAWLRAAIHRL